MANKISKIRGKFPAASVVLLLLFSCQSIPQKAKIQLKTVVPEKDSEEFAFPRFRNWIEYYRYLSGEKTYRRITRWSWCSFSLSDFNIPRDTVIMLVARYKRWRKVYDPQRQIFGSTTKRSTSTNLRNRFQFQSQRLPNVFVVKPTAPLFDFHDKSKVITKVSKGTFYKALKRKKKMVLVYLPSTNSIAWLRERDVKWESLHLSE